MASVDLKVTGMTCEHCSGRVESAVKSVMGVFGVFVDLSAGLVDVDFDENNTGAQAFVDAITEAGYKAEISV